MLLTKQEQILYNKNVHNIFKSFFVVICIMYCNNYCTLKEPCVGAFVVVCWTVIIGTDTKAKS